MSHDTTEPALINRGSSANPILECGLVLGYYHVLGIMWPSENSGFVA